MQLMAQALHQQQAVYSAAANAALLQQQPQSTPSGVLPQPASPHRTHSTTNPGKSWSSTNERAKNHLRLANQRARWSFSANQPAIRCHLNQCWIGAVSCRPASIWSESVLWGVNRVESWKHFFWSLDWLNLFWVWNAFKVNKTNSSEVLLILVGQNSSRNFRKYN